MENNNKNNAELGNIISSALAETNLMLVKRDRAELLIEYIKEMQETYGTSGELNILRMRIFNALGIDDDVITNWNFAKKSINPFKINHLKCNYCSDMYHKDIMESDDYGNTYCSKCYENYVIRCKLCSKYYKKYNENSELSICEECLAKIKK